MRAMAFDVGLKRIGVAVTDNLNIIATPLGTFGPKEIATFLSEYLKKERVSVFVLGKPLKMNGEKSESYYLVEQFSNWLKVEFPDIKQDWVDERFTSKIASKSLIENGIKKQERKNKKLLDAISATLILQTYINQPL